MALWEKRQGIMLYQDSELDCFLIKFKSQKFEFSNLI